ncbi:zinc finger protein 316-like [Myripristis murdjan]|uniref:Zinc finger protein 316-like n=1 Tax=Myripristis murdjan TaxID=586833 RepID=A0A667WK11_9TELE|nr:zinc finger protein 316-like [Myripristis murdjan]
MPSTADMTMFHSQLSSIMEKLVISAITEINKLMVDYCALLRLELNREKLDNGMLRKKLRLVLTNADQGVHFTTGELLDECQNAAENGSNRAGLQLYSGQRESIAGWKDGAQTTEAEEALRLADCKTEAVIVKHEQVHEEAAADGQLQLKAPALSPGSPLVSQQQDAAEPGTSSPTGWQFCSQPPEGSTEQSTSFKQAVDMEQQLSLSPAAGQLTDVELHIKREAESPDLSASPGVDLDNGFEFQPGMLSQMYPDSLPDTPVLAYYNFSLASKSQHTSAPGDPPDMSLYEQYSADGDASGHSSSQTGSRPHCSREPYLMASRASECIKYVCEDCGKGFPFLSVMKRHRLTHTGERTQHCGQCGMSFIRRSHLRRHELLHSGLRPFACQLCGRQFSRRAHLNTHMKTHRR